MRIFSFYLNKHAPGVKFGGGGLDCPGYQKTFSFDEDEMEDEAAFDESLVGCNVAFEFEIRALFG